VRLFSEVWKIDPCRLDKKLITPIYLITDAKECRNRVFSEWKGPTSQFVSLNFFQ